MRYRPEKPLHVKLTFFVEPKQELFSNHTHKHVSVVPKPLSFTRNTEENRDILENFTSLSFRQIEVGKKKLGLTRLLELVNITALELFAI